MRKKIFMMLVVFLFIFNFAINTFAINKNEIYKFSVPCVADEITSSMEDIKLFSYSTAYPNTHTNTGNQATDIVAIAKTQIGYVETGDNHTKYNAWYDGYDKGVIGWCAMFISWCANQAGIPTSIIAKTSSADNNAFRTPTYSFNNHTPQPGDIIYVDNMGDGNLDGSSDHVGLIEKVDSSYIYTIEGNYSDKVRTVIYNRNTGKSTYESANIVLYGVPNYNYSTTQPDDSSDGIITNTNQVLRYGDSSESVRQLQTALNKVMNAGLATDGKFGQATHDAVKAFQSKYGLTVDGDAGPATLTKLNQLAGGHTHSYSGTWHEADHPHREYTACSCGETKYTGKTVVVSTCSKCTTPGKPSLLNLSDIYCAGDEIELKWDETVNTTHYNVYVHKLNGAREEYYSFSTYHYAENGMKLVLSRGEYRIFVQSTNSNARTDDGSTWRFTNSDYCYISVDGDLEPTITTEFGGHTYELYDYSMKWSEAKQVCEELGGHLATITSADENEALSLFLQQGNNTRYFIGGTDENKEGTWEWVTAEEWTLNNYWGSGEPNNDNSKEHYLEISAGIWNDVPDNNVYQHGFILEKDRPIDVNEILPRATEEYGGHKYLLFDYSLTWHDAKKVCEELGGHLATATTEDEYNMLLDLVSKGTKADYFLGGTDEREEGVWEWITAEVWDYEEFWRSGEPSNYLGGEHYLKIDTAGVDVANKALEYRGFICEFDFVPYINVSPTINYLNKRMLVVDTNCINKPIVMSVYRLGKCVDIQMKVYDGLVENLEFTINDSFDEVKVMMFDSLDKLKPQYEEKVFTPLDWR